MILTFHGILVILVITVIIVTKVIMALMLKVVIEDRCVLKKWPLLDSHRALWLQELLSELTKSTFVLDLVFHLRLLLKQKDDSSIGLGDIIAGEIYECCNDLMLSKAPTYFTIFTQPAYSLVGWHKLLQAGRQKNLQGPRGQPRCEAVLSPLSSVWWFQ